MEQNLISHHSSGRNYRAKGKRVIQVLSLLAVCIWLLYQIKNSYHKHESYLQNPGERNISIVLGRNGILKYMNGATADSQDESAPEEFERREDGGVGDDELDVNIDEDVGNVSKVVHEEARRLNERNKATELAQSQAKQVLVVDTANQYSEMEIVDDNDESVHRVEAFLDENGIPPDASNIFFRWGGAEESLTMTVQMS